MYDNQDRAFIGVLSGTIDTDVCLVPGMANRHGLITGATGTGKTVTLQTMAETFSQMGVPVFAADVKGDLSGVAGKGGSKESIVKRVDDYKLKDKGFAFQSFPVQFWDVFGEQGAPVRATVGSMGPILLSRLLLLNDTQTAVLTVLFKLAADQNLALIDLKDLQKLIEYTGVNSADLSSSYGNLAAASLGAIQRAIISLAQQGAEPFFGEPDLNINDLIRQEGSKGVINILASDKLMHTPAVYSTFLLWLMNRLFEVLPEVGDMDKPKLVFFFDEAHLLFDDAPKVLLDKVEQVVRLIRSKGVGVYFISQNPSDMPDSILGQLGNRVQHALRAYTPKDQKALKAAAAAFRANPNFDTETVISELGVGEALISFLDEKGAPVPVERAFILPPQGQIGPLEAAARQELIKNSLVYRVYAQAQDRTSAYEVLDERLKAMPTKEQLAEQTKARKEQEKAEERQRKEAEKIAERLRKEQEKAKAAEEKRQQREAEQRSKFWAGTAKSVLAPLARQVIGSLLKRR